jgi:hypothetical protein
MATADDSHSRCAESISQPAYAGDLGWVHRNLVRHAGNLCLLAREFPLPQGRRPTEKHLCPPCVTRARCGSPTFDAFQAYHGPEPVRNGISCHMCNFARRRLVTDYLTSLGASIEQDVPIQATDDCTVFTDIVVTMPGGTPVALQLDSADAFAPSNIIGDTAAFKIKIAHEVFKSLYYRSQGVRLIRLKQNSMQAFDWRARLREALAGRGRYVYLEANPDDNSWSQIKGEVGRWVLWPVGKWLEASEERLTAATDSNSEDDYESEADHESEAACEPETLYE